MIRLFINAFRSPDGLRSNELDIVLKNNLSNQFINEIHIFISSDDKQVIAEYENDTKIIINNIPNNYRSTYYDYIQYINNILTSPNDLSIIANSDCYFDNSIEQLLQYDLRHHCVALSRWEQKDNDTIKMEVSDNSQDAWIFQGRIRPIYDCKFPLGTWGCDNKFAWQTTNAGYLNINPCLSVILHHLHKSKYRNNHPYNEGFKETIPHVTIDSCNLPAKNSLLNGVMNYSLFGTEEKYILGAKMNAILIKYIYPGFWCRFYVDESISKTLIDELQKLGSEIILEPRSQNLFGLFWRLKGLTCKGVNLIGVRDADSRLSVRDREAIIEFVNSEANYHVFRDHKYHRTKISAGLFSSKKPINDIEDLINSYAYKSRYGDDERFLREIIWPLIKNETMTHDTFNTEEAGRYIGKHIHPSFMNYKYCGERVYQYENIDHIEHNIFGNQPQNRLFQ